MARSDDSADMSTTASAETKKTNTATTMSRVLGRAFGPVTSGIVDYVDVDGIVQRIDVDALLDRVDIDHIIDKVDMNKVLMKVDINNLLSKVDLNALLRKVDVSELVERAEIGAIVARSTSGVFAPLMDGLRSQFVIIDQFTQGVGWLRKTGVPKAPGFPGEPRQKMPKGSANISLAVQGRYSGTMSRGLAFLIDQFLISVLFSFVLYLLTKGIDLFLRHSVSSIDVNNHPVGIIIMYGLWQFVYFVSALAATGRTIGKAIVGLRCVNNDDGSIVTSWRAFVRTIFLPVSTYGVVGVLLGLVRSDRREMHDLIAGTAVVYNWDARFAKYREKVTEYQELYTDQDLDKMESTGHSRKKGVLFSRKKKKKKKKTRSVIGGDSAHPDCFTSEM